MKVVPNVLSVEISHLKRMRCTWHKILEASKVIDSDQVSVGEKMRKNGDNLKVDKGYAKLEVEFFTYR